MDIPVDVDHNTVSDSYTAVSATADAQDISATEPNVATVSLNQGPSESTEVCSVYKRCTRQPLSSFEDKCLNPRLTVKSIFPP